MGYKCRDVVSIFAFILPVVVCVVIVVVVSATAVGSITVAVYIWSLPPLLT